MADAIKAAAALAEERFAAYIRSLPSGSGWWWWQRPSSSVLKYDTEKMRENTRRLIRMLRWIRATLDGAETRSESTTNESFHLWLRELQGVADAAEDVLDEFVYEAMRLEFSDNLPARTPLQRRFTPADEDISVRDESPSSFYDEMPQVRQQSPCTPAAHEIVAFLCDVEHRIEEISSRFDATAKHKSALWLEGEQRSVVETPPGRQPTSSFMEESRVFGREEDLGKIKEFLQSNDDSRGSVPVIAIVGMGGLGKTTLAQLAFNDHKIKMHFDLMAWVFVSQNFDLERLTRAITESFFQEERQILCLDPLQRQLKKKLVGKKFLVVFDDVWDAEDLSSNWDRLTAPLLSCSDQENARSRGKIILTARNDKVSRMTRATSTHRLSPLQDADCFELFKQRAFRGRDPSSHPKKLTAIGRKISHRCEGLPLVAKSLGGLLHSVEDEETWNIILESKIWHITQENNIMPVLRFSYQHLPAHLKRCFRFCAMFPEGYEFDKDRLVFMWMAHGYVEAKEGRLLESIGKEYFDDLLSRSFFQQSPKHNIFLMYALIHDLARSFSEGECYSFQDNKPYSIQENIRHLSINVLTHDALFRLPDNIHRLESIRSFSLAGFVWFRVFSCEPLHHLFATMKHLRVLDLSYVEIQPLPDSIGCLKHLRYLGLRHNNMWRLPEFVGNLYHLQTLEISACPQLRYLGEEPFPSTLQVLRIHGCPFVMEWYTRHRQRLAYIPSLEIEDKRSLSLVLRNGLTVHQAVEAYLEKLKSIRYLGLRWDCCTDVGFDASSVASEVLENLRPHEGLCKLEIQGYMGRRFPSWLGDRSFQYLNIVTLLQCSQFKFLPPLGQLPSLIKLYVEGAPRLEHIGHEFLVEAGSSSSSTQRHSFPCLKILEFHNLPVWEGWQGTNEGDFPLLDKLILKHCPRLRALPHLPPTLKELKLEACEELVSLSPSYSTTQALQSLKSLRCLSLTGCPKLNFSASEIAPLYIPEIWVDGIQVYTGQGTSISSQIKETGVEGRASDES